MNPAIGITLGDPAGVGPEVVSAALASGRLPTEFEYRIFGSADGFVPGNGTRESARSAFSALEEAVEAGNKGEVKAVVTGPVSKKSMHDVGFAFPGQTEFFAERTGTHDHAMCLTGGRLTVVLVTAHVPLREVVLREDEVVRVGNLLAEFSLRRKIAVPRLAVAGFNPHAGEGGDLGREEIEIIAPACARLRTQWNGRASFSDPISPDTLFNRAVEGEFDGVLCMYHDQGLIPLKLHAFDEGVNVTLGLPFPRTSPDHGTAFGIAGRGMARPDSMIAAIRLAAELAETP